MSTRRIFLVGLGGLAIAGSSYAVGGFHDARAQANTRLFGQSTVINSSSGVLEFAEAGDGPPLMMIHGTGGGFDQGLLFEAALRERGFRIVAPSRFGYLSSAFSDDASPAHQADVLAELLDHLRIDRLPVVGGAAGALMAAEFALRHPDRCSHLGLLVPAANLTNRVPAEFTALQQLAVNTVLGSDASLWALSRLAPARMIKTLLATDPALLDIVGAKERQRAEAILSQIFPTNRNTLGLRNDAI